MSFSERLFRSVVSREPPTEDYRLSLDEKKSVMVDKARKLPELSFVIPQGRLESLLPSSFFSSTVG